MNVGAEARKTLLVVEDDLTLRSAMTDALESAGCTVLAARDGKDVNEFLDAPSRSSSGTRPRGGK